MAEKPIIFSTEMVRAILEGRKTMTRRVVKPQPFLVLSEQEWQARALSGIDYVRPLNSYTPEELVAKCPYGTSGDILWVRETWMHWGCTYCETDICYGMCSPAPYVYKATGDWDDDWKWRSPIHMPREATRIFLRVTKVRVERLQDITEEEAVKEGFLSNTEVMEYWDKLNAKRGFRWDQNPWVWVIEFDKQN